MKSKKFITGLLIAAATLSSAVPVCAEEITDTTEITEPGTATSSVAMTYADEYGNYVPVDNFIVTIPKTLDVNPKEDSVYNIEVQGTIDADRSVWVCADESVTLTLTDESLASTYGIEKKQTLTNTLDKIQYTSEEIVEGYIGQGTIAKSTLDYEVECEYAGSINFYINAISNSNILDSSISQNGYMTLTGDKCKEILQQALPAEVYTEIETNSTYNIENFLTSWSARSFVDTTAVLITYQVNSYTDSIQYVVNFHCIKNYPSLTRNTEVVDGKYRSSYTYSASTQEYCGGALTVNYTPSTDTYSIEEDSNYSKFGGSRTYTESDTLTVVRVYLSPRCTYIIE